MKKILSAIVFLSLFFLSFNVFAGQTFVGDITGNAATVANLTVSSATTVGQAAITPVFNAGNFDASGSMTWTVEAGDVTTYSYIIEGKRMTIWFSLVTTTVGGTLDNRLRILIPASKTAAKEQWGGVYMLDNSVRGNGFYQVTAGGNQILIGRNDNANFTASTNATYVFGTVVIEIQ